jgi:hypothetical protein
MKAVTNVHIDYLLDQLLEDPEAVLSLIDEDEDLKRRENTDGLVIANASKTLWTPEYEHQLYAKGIVYRRDPYELVSLPLLKVYNYGEKEVVNDLTDEMAEQSDLRLTLPVKEDGYMAQLFEWDGSVYTTTRSILEGVEMDTSGFDFDYVGNIRKVAEDKYPALLDPEVMRDKTVVCEAIHPETRIVTDYGDREALVVLSVFDRETHTYWSNNRVRAWCLEHDLKGVDYLASEVTLEEACAMISELEAEHIPEGGMLCFEREGRITHRVKLKSAEWSRYFSAKYNCTLKSLAELIFMEPEYEEWENVEQLLIDEDIPEEVLEHYEEHHKTYLEWLDACRLEAAEMQEELDTVLEKVGPLDGDNGAKDLVLHIKEHYSKREFHLLMGAYRKGDGVLFTIMWQNELFNGSKLLVQEARLAASQ